MQIHCSYLLRETVRSQIFRVIKFLWFTLTWYFVTCHTSLIHFPDYFTYLWCVNEHLSVVSRIGHTVIHSIFHQYRASFIPVFFLFSENCRTIPFSRLHPHQINMEDLAVEVCGENGAYYKVSISLSTMHVDFLTFSFHISKACTCFKRHLGFQFNILKWKFASRVSQKTRLDRRHVLIDRAWFFTCAPNYLI